MKNLRILLLFGIFLLANNVLQAQNIKDNLQGITSGGGMSEENSTGSISFSIGQLVMDTKYEGDGSGLFIAEGVQQPLHVLVATAIEGTEDINLNISAYPNPATDYLILNTGNFDTSKLSYRLYNITGQLVKHENVTGNRSAISVSDLLPSTYFLKVIKQENSNTQELKTFKIIKN